MRPRGNGNVLCLLNVMGIPLSGRATASRSRFRSAKTVIFHQTREGLPAEVLQPNTVLLRLLKDTRGWHVNGNTGTVVLQEKHLEVVGSNRIGV